MVVMTSRLLAADEPAAFSLERPTGTSPYLLTCDHASGVLPRALGDLGLSAFELQRHIAVDIGIAGVARRLSQALDACLVLQNYSRLAIDANRPPGTPQSITTLSERTPVPGNEGLSPAERELREREIFWPYHDCIQSQVDARVAAGRPLALCCLHSFTPSFLDADRKWHAGLLYQHEARLSHALLEALRAEGGLVIGDNEPYHVSDETDYTVVVHAERRGLPCLEIEIRQDLIADASGQQAWADRLARLLPQVYAKALG